MVKGEIQSSTMEYTLETLEVYQLSETFSDKIWKVVAGWDQFLKWGIGSQMTRSADSVSANIAEGYGRHYYAESKKFYFYARASLMETKAWLGKCKRRGIVPEKECDELMNEADMILAKLINYIKFVSRSQTNSKKDSLS
jgi:four helix bundle protein